MNNGPYFSKTKVNKVYYPFGMVMPNRSFSTGTYRFGFNGKENDNEVKGTANEQDYGMRIYDTRLGKFLSVDPLTKQYPELTPYQFASNTPIIGIDRDGEEILSVNSSMYRMKYLGYATTTMTGHTFDNYDIQTISENTPENYHGNDAPWARVGTNGADEPLMGPFFKQSTEPSEVSLEPGEDRDVQIPVTTKKANDAARSRVDKANGVAGGIMMGIDVINYFGEKKERDATLEEIDKRYSFYRATRFVDKTGATGQMRSDLINYITDGSLPINSSENPIKDFESYKNQIIDQGQIIMNKEKIKVRSNETDTPKTYTVKLTESNR